MDSSTNANGVPQVVIFSQPFAAGGGAAGSHPYDGAARKALTKQLTFLGSLQIIFGCLLIVFQIVCVVLASYYYHHGGFPFIGYGIWIGTFFVITGAFGCAAGRKNNRGFMITFNVMSIVAASLNALLVILAAFSLVILDFFIGYSYHRYYDYPDDARTAYLEERRRAQRASIAMESLMIIMALAEVVVAVWSSVVCCKLGACCCDCGDACCCPPVPVPTRVFWAQQPPIDGSQQQQQPMLVYAAAAPNPTANDVFHHENKHQKQFHYQQLMSDPNIPSDGDIGDHTRLCS